MTPLMPSLGITVFYLETGAGKDLDNIFGDLEVLPTVLDIARPPAVPVFEHSAIEDLEQWREHDRSTTQSAVGDVGFIEAVALKGIEDDRLSPGSVIVALSQGADGAKAGGAARSTAAGSADRFPDRMEACAPGGPRCRTASSTVSVAVVQDGSGRRGCCGRRRPTTCRHASGGPRSH
jgi:hypothetical protein